MARKYTIFFCTAFVLGLVGGFFTHKSFAKPIIVEKPITITQHDTSVVIVPKIVQRTITEKEYIRVVDTVRLRDTLYLREDRETVIAKDTNYLVQASGIRPTIDRVEIYGTTYRYTDTVFVKDKKRWGIGLQVGYGISVQPQPKVAPYVGVGISYNILRF